MLRKVAAIIGGHTAPFELGVVCEVFGVDRSDDGLPVFDFAVCSHHAEPLHWAGGLSLATRHRLDYAADADLIVVPGGHVFDATPTNEPILQALRDAVDRGAYVLSVCTGAFVLAEAGLLKGRSATTHWHHLARFTERYPDIQMHPDKLYVQDGPVITSAGTAAGIDACLHLVRTELGATVANGIARRMVVPPHRDGGQAQFVDTPVPHTPSEDDAIAALLEWIPANLHLRLPVERLAARAHMSQRSFARRFTRATGTTPARWIAGQRVMLAQRLLEDGDLDIEQIATRSGFPSAELLRHHFTQIVGTTPSRYRRQFRSTD